jgi:hypothetical protein
MRWSQRRVTTIQVANMRRVIVWMWMHACSTQQEIAVARDRNRQANARYAQCSQTTRASIGDNSMKQSGACCKHPAALLGSVHEAHASPRTTAPGRAGTHLQDQSRGE